MVKQEQTDIYTQWYQLWMEQSRAFFESADKNLKNMFEANKFANPEDNLKQINAWLETLQHQWEFTKLTEEQKVYANYWQQMMQMYKEASNKMVEEWIQRSHENNPVKNVHDLYDLWLKSCHEVYQKSMQTKSYQEAYGEFMNAAMKFWKSNIPKE